MPEPDNIVNGLNAPARHGIDDVLHRTDVGPARFRLGLQTLDRPNESARRLEWAPSRHCCKSGSMSAGVQICSTFER
jgi:hypothetical protein